jgi:hypothetical protein
LLILSSVLNRVGMPLVLLFVLLEVEVVVLSEECLSEEVDDDLILDVLRILLKEWTPG